LVELLDMHPWSSHKGYPSDGSEWNWLHERVKSQISRDRKLKKRIMLDPFPRQVDEHDYFRPIPG
jgi:hypothetical protein